MTRSEYQDLTAYFVRTTAYERSMDTTRYDWRLLSEVLFNELEYLNEKMDGLNMTIKYLDQDLKRAKEELELSQKAEK